MWCMCPTECTIFIKLQFSRSISFIFSCRIVTTFTCTTCKSYNISHDKPYNQNHMMAEPSCGFRIFICFMCYSMISLITPAPTVLPPSRIAKRRPTSMAIGVISSPTTCTLSPGITISTPSSSVITPVTSVVLK